MSRWGLRHLLVLSLVLLCLFLAINPASSAHALALEPSSQDDLDNNAVDFSSDFQGASGAYGGADGPVHRKNVDEFSNYDDEAGESDGIITTYEPKGTIHGADVDLSNEEKKSFFLSLAMIVVSEIGDKTFLIAAIMAMKHPRLLVFSAAISALAVMTILSAAFGHAVPNLIPRTFTNYLAAILFFCFGIRMFYDGYHMTPEDAQHELEEVTQELQDKEDLELLQQAEAGSISNTVNDDNDNTTLDKSGHEDLNKPQGKAVKESSGLINLFQLLFSPVFVQTFIMTFLAEWGDRSQIATIALAAAHNMVWVSIGGVFGHSLCTGVAVIGGRMLASRISVRTVTLAGAIMFEIFAIVSLYEAIYDV